MRIPPKKKEKKQKSTKKYQKSWRSRRQCDTDSAKGAITFAIHSITHHPSLTLSSSNIDQNPPLLNARFSLSSASLHHTVAHLRSSIPSDAEKTSLISTPWHRLLLSLLSRSAILLEDILPHTSACPIHLYPAGPSHLARRQNSSIIPAVWFPARIFPNLFSPLDCTTVEQAQREWFFHLFIVPARTCSVLPTAPSRFFPTLRIPSASSITEPGSHPINRAILVPRNRRIQLSLLSTFCALALSRPTLNKSIHCYR